MKNEPHKKIAKPILKPLVFGDRESKTDSDLLYIFNSPNPVDAFKSFNWSRRQYDKRIDYVLGKYGKDAIEPVEYLNEKFNEYFNKYKVKKEETTKTYSNEDSKKLVLDVLSSGKSIGEYCAEHLYCDMTNIHKALETIYRDSKTITLVEKTLNSCEKWTFRYGLTFILKRMADKDFNIIDYYLETKLSLFDFKKLLTNISVEDSTNLAIFMKKYKTCIYAKNYEDPTKFKDNKLNEGYNIYGKDLTSNDREIISSWMDKNEIPYTSQTYPIVRDMYISGELIEKVKTI